MSAFIEQPAEPAKDRNDVYAALLLGVAATLTAVASFLGGDQDGKALEHFSRSNSVLSDSNFYFTKGNQEFDGDVSLYREYRLAELREEPEVAAYLRGTMGAQLSAAVDWAEAKGPDADPFADEDSPYDADDVQEDGETLRDVATAEEGQQEAKDEFDAARASDDKGDKFGISTILFALTLFFGGISTLQERSRVTRGLLGLGSVSLAAGVVQFVLAMLA